jgi:tRNA(fMet)-specific endonuclease VapC
MCVSADIRLLQEDVPMNPALIDTDILSMFLRGAPKVVGAFDRYLTEFGRINISIVTYYEILSGLKHRDARRQLDDFLQFSEENNILPLTENSCSISADIYAAGRRSGHPLDDIDILIAGIALANGLVLTTHNRRHFERISGLTIEDWNAD